MESQYPNDFAAVKARNRCCQMRRLSCTKMYPSTADLLQWVKQALPVILSVDTVVEQASYSPRA